MLHPLQAKSIPGFPLINQGMHRDNYSPEVSKIGKVFEGSSNPSFQATFIIFNCLCQVI
jgi:hypothetical protein